MTAVPFEVPVLQGIKGHVHTQLLDLVETFVCMMCCAFDGMGSHVAELHTGYFASAGVAALTCRVAALWTLNDKG